MDRFTSFSFGVVIALSFGVASAADGLIGYWKLAGDARDSSGAGRHAGNHGVRFTKDGAVFNGRALITLTVTVRSMKMPCGTLNSIGVHRSF